MQAFTEAADNYSPGSFLKYLIESSGYLDLLRQEGQEGQVRLENLEELVSAAEEWSSDNEGSIAEFLDDAALLSSVDDMRTKVENKGRPRRRRDPDDHAQRQGSGISQRVHRGRGGGSIAQPQQPE